MKFAHTALPALLLALGAASWAQPTQPAVEQLLDKLEAQRRILHDWAGLIRYGSANTEVRPPKPGETRVVFLGDDHTERWGEGPTPFFPGKPYFNRGIAGQTSAQMLVRFRQDVVTLQPSVVVIQAGANDLAGIAGPATTPMIAENILSMIDIAKANGIRVVLASVPPVCDCAGTKQSTKRPIGKIMGVNEWMEEQAAKSGAVFLNLAPALGGRTLKKEMTVDGFLLNEAAYQAMAPLAEQAISAAVQTPAQAGVASTMFRNSYAAARPGALCGRVPQTPAKAGVASTMFRNSYAADRPGALCGREPQKI
ncbi:MAG: capsular biosynthesis protein [Bryobacterales bacterium]|nr:capsular biosynthesis protein [Bryobacterales bacterium]